MLIHRPKIRVRPPVWVVAIWGDLRNFGKEDVPKIIAWWKRITTETTADQVHEGQPYISFRGGILQIDVEGEDKSIVLGLLPEG